MNHVEKIQYKAKEILVLDYGRSSGDALIEQIEVFEKEILASAPEGSYSLLFFQDITGIRVDIKAVERWKIIANKARSRQKKNAVIGVSGVRKIFLSAITEVSGMKAEIFNSKQEALDWLAKD